MTQPCLQPSASLPSSTVDLCSQLAKLHNINITSVIVLNMSLELIGSHGLESFDFVSFIKLLRPLVDASFNYTSITFRGQNWVVVPRDEFVFAFAV